MPSPDLHATGLRPAEFGAALLDPGQSVPDDLRDHLHRRAGKRFDVYRNNVVSSLLEAMRKVYPSLAAIMGEANFNTVARAFVVQHPPRAAMMLGYGAGFDSFLETYAPLGKSPFLADVARAERAWLDAYHAPDIAPLGGDALLACQPDELMGLTFEAHPAAWLLQSAYPAADLFAWRTQVPANGVDLDEAQTVLITRPVLDVEVRTLTPAEAAFFAVLLTGGNLGEAIGGHMAAAPDTDLGQLIGLLLASGAFIPAGSGPAPQVSAHRGDAS